MKDIREVLKQAEDAVKQKEEEIRQAQAAVLVLRTVVPMLVESGDAPIAAPRSEDHNILEEGKPTKRWP